MPLRQNRNVGKIHQMIHWLSRFCLTNLTKSCKSINQPLVHEEFHLFVRSYTNFCGFLWTIERKFINSVLINNFGSVQKLFFGTWSKKSATISHWIIIRNAMQPTFQETFYQLTEQSIRNPLQKHLYKSAHIQFKFATHLYFVTFVYPQIE